MKSSQNKKTSFKSKILVLSVALVLAGGIAVWAFFSPKNSYKNYAEQIARPIEKTLSDAGAVKKCGYGDDGRGSDNQRPWYNSFYELPAGREEAIKLVNKAASSNGYSLTHASKEDRGDLGSIADEYIANWYFDNSKTSTYDDLQKGSEKLAFGINNDGEHSLSDISCGTKDPVVINSGEKTTMITISVKLPEFKQ